jgi:hypothetical protein
MPARPSSPLRRNAPRQFWPLAMRGELPRMEFPRRLWLLRSGRCQNCSFGQILLEMDDSCRETETHPSFGGIISR